MLKYESEYNSLVNKTLSEGEWVENKRTGKRCKTIINHDFVYDASDAGEVPLLTQKQVFATSAIAEVLGYMRGYTNAQDFADVGAKTWFANANQTQDWVNNPIRKGQDDCGLIYGAVARDWHGIDLIRKVYNNLRNGIDDRCEIVSFLDPSKFDKGCLRPCAYEWIWSLVNGKLSLTVTQRSCDLPLGASFNTISFYFLLKLMAKITGNVPDKVYHKLVNVHIYEDQVEPLQVQINNTPKDCTPKLEIAEWVNCLEDVLENKHAREYFTLTEYEHCGKVHIPFTE